MITRTKRELRSEGGVHLNEQMSGLSFGSPLPWGSSDPISGNYRALGLYRWKTARKPEDAMKRLLTLTLEKGSLQSHQGG